MPVLGFQILLAWTLGLGFAMVCFIAGKTKVAGKVVRFFSTFGLDLIICLALWIAAAALWSQSPMDRSYFAPGPYPPNYVYYPYSDAEAHDLGAQYVLIGQGLNNNQYHDKPFYMLFLTVLHVLTGQNYLAVVQLQAIILALFPAILYLIGKLIHSRTAGILVGIFVILQQANSIAATIMIQVSHSRLMMTEFPTAFGIALLSLVLIYWIKHPQESSIAPMLAGRDFRRPDSHANKSVISGSVCDSAYHSYLWKTLEKMVGCIDIIPGRHHAGDWSLVLCESDPRGPVFHRGKNWGGIHNPL